MLEVTGATKRIGTATVLDDISFNLERGATLGIIGPSGSGKSTILRCLNRLEELDAGSVTLEGTPIQRLPVHELRRRVGLVSQRFSLFAHLTATENIELGLRRTRQLERPEARRRAAEWLDRVGLHDIENRRPHELSGGQQQRVAIARAAALEPQVLLFDEITSALDPELVGEVERVVADIAQSGISVMIVTHEVSFVAMAADHLLMLESGRVVEIGATTQMLTDPKHPRTRGFLARHRRGPVTHPTPAES